jgi:hypothetical protein
MSRRKLGLRTDDLKEMRVKLVPTWCTNRSHMAKAKTKSKLSRIRITTSQSKLLSLRIIIIIIIIIIILIIIIIIIIIITIIIIIIIIIRRRRRRVASYADLLIIGQRSVQITKEENLNLSRRLQTWLYPALEVELVGMIIYHMFFQCFNLLLGGLILVQIFMCVLMHLYFLLTRSPEILP